ncbi:glycosyltransferase [Thiothrix fructosivorans]|uniref:Glycosyltransferase n=1 Tax=Thiothrix fructosivorans TaxID=111770 RepID=A0A8B0SDS0_9GAMM|nr:glycosyltransferase [Thiothrix fructosivorans]MBO0614360.1 glycosyltransferase [Thiothrix fructosivorans]QTX09204.1 glycosyltransferase [Thiothrix fructosivorans]
MFFHFITVNYNNCNFTKEYIYSINSIPLDEGDHVNVIIVDNKSNNEDYRNLEIFCRTFDSVELIRNDTNLGYFKGLNIGITIAKKDSNTLIIAGNNDLTFDKDFLKNLKKIAYNKNTLVIAPNIITLEGRQQNPHVINEVPRIEKIKCEIYYSNYYIGQSLRFINRLFRNPLNKNEKILTNDFGQMPIKRGIGACYILTPHFFDFFEKLDDRVFLWGEEALLSNQVESVSGITLYDPTIKITHHESASVVNIESKKRYDINKASYKIYKKYL